jgi:signal peptidase
LKHLAAELMSMNESDPDRGPAPGSADEREDETGGTEGVGPADDGPGRGADDGGTGAGDDPDEGSADATAGPGRADGSVRPDGARGWVRWLLTTDRGVVPYVREVLTSVLAVLLVGVVLFAVSGLWPPMVAVESPSMKPNLQTGDLVFVMEEHRLAAPAAYGGTGVVTHRTGEAVGYRKFGMGGDVVVYRPDGRSDRTPIIHRAMFYVNGSENWYDTAVAVDPDAVGGYEDCDALPACPAPHAGFITKGDNERTNVQYDQVSRLSAPVRPAWVVGTAEFRVPLLGNLRLWASRAGVPSTGATSGESPPEAKGVGAGGDRTVGNPVGGLATTTVVRPGGARTVTWPVDATTGRPDWARTASDREPASPDVTAGGAATVSAVP